MHPIATTKNWGHHLHDRMLNAWHHIEQHLLSRHFWTGVGIAVLIMGVLAALFVLTKHAPIQFKTTYPFNVPYAPVY